MSIMFLQWGRGHRGGGGDGLPVYHDDVTPGYLRILTTGSTCPWLLGSSHQVVNRSRLSLACSLLLTG